MSFTTLARCLSQSFYVLRSKAAAFRSRSLSLALLLLLPLHLLIGGVVSVASWHLVTCVCICVCACALPRISGHRVGAKQQHWDLLAGIVILAAAAATAAASARCIWWRVRLTGLQLCCSCSLPAAVAAAAAVASESASVAGTQGSSPALFPLD